MLIQKITGGLGNQMFQYAYIKALALRNKINFKLDILGFEQYKLHKYSLEFFNIEKNYVCKNEIPFYERLHSNNRYLNYFFLKIRGFFKKIDKNYYKEKTFNFDSNYFNIKFGYIEGYFQSEKYFIDFEKEIRKDFEFRLIPSKKNKEMIEIIRSCNSVSIHIRRGDYITNEIANKHHGICSLDYYEKAVDYFKSKIKNPVFFFFSDDIEWVKKNLVINNKSYYIDRNDANTNYEDMRLMSLCKHNIIANSSFSWWGAWLNGNKDKIVIAPKKWSKANNFDRIPLSWIEM